jgi:hypothetical protein
MPMVLAPSYCVQAKFVRVILSIKLSAAVADSMGVALQSITDLFFRKIFLYNK